MTDQQAPRRHRARSRRAGRWRARRRAASSGSSRSFSSPTTPATWHRIGGSPRRGAAPRVRGAAGAAKVGHSSDSLDRWPRWPAPALRRSRSPPARCRLVARSTRSMIAAQVSGATAWPRRCRCSRRRPEQGAGGHEPTRLVARGARPARAAVRRPDAPMPIARGSPCTSTRTWFVDGPRVRASRCAGRAGTRIARRVARGRARGAG